MAGPYDDIPLHREARDVDYEVYALSPSVTLKQPLTDVSF